MSSDENIFDNPRSEAVSYARRSYHSLQDTNLCINNIFDQCDSTNRVLKGSDLAGCNGEWNKNGNASTNEPNNEQEDVNKNEKPGAMAEIRNENSVSESEIQCEDTDSQIEALYNEMENGNSANEPEVQCQDTSSQIKTMDDEIDAYVPHTKNNEIPHCRGNTQQKEADCAGTTDISIQMYRYLKHQDLKRKIIDYNKREHLFITKNSWYNALRLREMRNEVILQKYKNLYENQDLKIDEETREIGMKVIHTMETLHKERAKICNSMLYSDDAKELWKQWTHEDDEIAKTECNSMRDLRLEELEEEWKSLALCDKNRISQLYNRVMNKSSLQDEHMLAVIIKDANNRQKQYMNYIAS